MARPASCCSDTATCEDGETASDAHCTTDEDLEGVCHRNAVCCSEVFCRAHASDSAPKWWVWVLLAVGGVLLLAMLAFFVVRGLRTSSCKSDTAELMDYQLCLEEQQSMPMNEANEVLTM